jgi:DNA repair ATPase RecN
MPEEYITIKTFAKKIGLTVQAIYRRLDGDLKPYVHTYRSKKYIHTDALAYYESYPKEFKAFNKSLKKALESVETVEKMFNGNADKPDECGILNTLNILEKKFNENADKADEYGILNTLNTLNDTLNTLKQQIEVKDGQIAELNERLREAHEHMRNNQVLIAMDKKENNERWYRRLFRRRNNAAE